MSNKTAKSLREERDRLFKDDPESDKQLPLIVDEIRARVGSTKRQAFEIGRLLTKAKAIVGHGKFKDWIKNQKFDFGYQTANNFMNVYRYCLENPALVQSIKASVLYRIASPKFPEDLRRHLFKHANALEKITNDEIKDLCGRFKDKELDLDSPEIKGLIKYRQEQDQYLAYTAELNEVIGKLEILGKTVVKLSSEITWPILTGKERTAMTKVQAQKVEDLIKDINGQVDNLKPDFDLVKRIKPRLVTSGE